MNKKHILINWKFDTEAWAVAMAVAVSIVGRDGVAELMEVSPQCIAGWEVSRYKGVFTYPNMTNFIKFCNIFDMDVRLFYCLDE